MPTNQNFSVTISQQDALALRGALFTEDGCENFAVLFCGSVLDPSGLRLLAREWWPTPPEAYRERLSYHLEISPSFLNRVIDHAAGRGLSPVLVHSHPRASRAEYSPSDDYGEGRLLPVLAQLVPGLTPASLLMTPDEIRGRHLIGGKFVSMGRVSVVGLMTETYSQPAEEGEDDLEEFDRQVRAIGASGQRTLNALRVGIIGLGGTGSAVSEQLVRLGIRDFVLVDPDQVERSNLSRLWGTLHADVGREKVNVITDHLRTISPTVAIRAIRSTVVRQQVLQELRDRDLIFACTDNHWSRAVINRFAHQYLVPAVDMGIRLDARGGRVSAVGGQVSLVGAGLSCLRCSGLINAERVRSEAMPVTERKQLALEGYVEGLDDPEPSVISLNTTVAGLAVTAGVSLFTALLGGRSPLQLRYDATRGVVFPVDARHDPGCDVCSNTDGVKGLGDLQAVSAYE